MYRIRIDIENVLDWFDQKIIKSEQHLAEVLKYHAPLENETFEEFKKRTFLDWK